MSCLDQRPNEAYLAPDYFASIEHSRRKERTSFRRRSHKKLLIKIYLTRNCLIILKRVICPSGMNSGSQEHIKLIYQFMIKKCVQQIIRLRSVPTAAFSDQAEKVTRKQNQRRKLLKKIAQLSQLDESEVCLDSQAQTSNQQESSTAVDSSEAKVPAEQESTPQEAAQDAAKPPEEEPEEEVVEQKQYSGSRGQLEEDLDIYMQGAKMKMGKREILPYSYPEQVNAKFDLIAKDLKDSGTFTPFNRFLHKPRESTRDLENLLDDYEDDDADYAKIMSSVQEFLSHGIVDIMLEEHFQVLYSDRRFSNYVHVFTSQFFERHPTFLKNEQLVSICQNPALSHLLRVVRPQERLIYYRDTQELLDRLKNTKSDPLLILHYLYQENAVQIVGLECLDIFCQHLLKLRWGPESHHASLGAQLQNLLLIRYKLLKHKPLKLYLADLFFGVENYDAAIMSVVLHLLLLQRLVSGKSSSDVLRMLNKVLGEEKFKFYLEQELGQVLKHYPVQVYHSNFRKQLFEYKGADSIKIQPTTYLDNLFFRSSRIVSGPEIVFYNPGDLDPLLKKIRAGAEQAALNEQLKAAILRGDTVYLSSALAKASNLEPSSRLLEDSVRQIHFQGVDSKAFISALQTMPYLSYMQRQEEFQSSQLHPLFVETDDPNGLEIEENTQVLCDSDDGELWNELIDELGLEAKETSAPARKGEELAERKDKNLTNQSKFSFSQQIKPDASSENLVTSGGFLSYLKSVKKIDQEVQQQEQQSKLMQKQEIDKAKQIFSRDAQNLKQVQKDILKQAPQEQFQKIVQQQKIKQDQQSSQVQVLEQKSDKPTQAPAKPVKKVELVLDSPSLTLKAVSILERAIDLQTDISKQLDKLAHAFSNLKPTPDEPVQYYLIHELTNQINFQRLDAPKIFATLFCKNLQPTNSADLRVTFTTQFGDIEKDYSQYITKTAFPYALAQGYDRILEFLARDGYYNRLIFKRLLAHIALYQPVIYDSTLELVTNICLKQKIPQTYCEFIYLLLKRKTSFAQHHISIIIACLMQFKNYELETELLIVEFYKRTEFSLEYRHIEFFIQKLLDRQLRDRYMSFYENIKDEYLNRKLKNLEQQDYAKLQGEFKTSNRQLLAQFVRTLVSTLLKQRLVEEARLIMNDSRSIKYPLQVEDYNAWIATHEQLPEEAIKIFAEMTKKLPDGVQHDTIMALLKVIQESKHQEKIKQFFQELMKDYVISKKVALNEILLTEITQTYKRLKEHSSFLNFLKFLLESGYLPTIAQRAQFFKIMNLAEDDVLKSSLRGVIEKLFEGQTIQKKGQKGKEPAGGQVVQRKTEIIKAEDYYKDKLQLEGLKETTRESKPGSGKRRGRSSVDKFTAIEEDSISQKPPDDSKAVKKKQ